MLQHTKHLRKISNGIFDGDKKYIKMALDHLNHEEDQIRASVLGVEDDLKKTHPDDDIYKVIKAEHEIAASELDFARKKLSSGAVIRLQERFDQLTRVLESTERGGFEKERKELGESWGKIISAKSSLINNPITSLPGRI